MAFYMLGLFILVFALDESVKYLFGSSITCSVALCFVWLCGISKVYIGFVCSLVLALFRARVVYDTGTVSNVVYRVWFAKACFTKRGCCIKVFYLLGMDFNIFVLSTMSLEDTKKRCLYYDLKFEDSICIQKLTWPRRLSISVKLWIGVVHPVVNELLKDVLPYMDACVVWYHDHCVKSCLKVQGAVSSLSSIVDNLWLVGASFDLRRDKHASKIKKTYNQNGFERPCLIKPLDNSIEIILRSQLELNSKLYSF